MEGFHTCRRWLGIGFSSSNVLSHWFSAPKIITRRSWSSPLQSSLCQKPLRSGGSGNFHEVFENPKNHPTLKWPGTRPKERGEGFGFFFWKNMCQFMKKNMCNLHTVIVIFVSRIIHDTCTHQRNALANTPHVRRQAFTERRTGGCKPSSKWGRDRLATRFCTSFTHHHGNPKPSFLGVITHILGA